jgi:hypothetical protein
MPSDDLSTFFLRTLNIPVLTTGQNHRLAHCRTSHHSTYYIHVPHAIWETNSTHSLHDRPSFRILRVLHTFWETTYLSKHYMRDYHSTHYVHDRHTLNDRHALSVGHCMRDNHATYRPSYFMWEIIDLSITYQNHNLHMSCERLLLYTLYTEP